MATTTTIRPATGADVAAVTALLAAQLDDHGIAVAAPALTRTVADLVVRPHRGRLLVACVDDRPVGVAALSLVWPIEHGARGAWLEELYVDPAHRGRGLGGALLRAACAVVAEAGGVAVDLEVDATHAAVERLYAREGFVPLSRTRWVRRLAPVPPPALPWPDVVEGGCLCGAIRYRVTARPLVVTHCHCSRCRRSTGAPVVTWAVIPATAFALSRGTPAVHCSSATGRRAFCPECGTAITFTESARPTEVDVTAGSLDRPELAVPTQHEWITDRVPWLHLDDDLPRHPERDPGEGKHG